jgi:transcriptional regulator with XRE-family HTH domain
MTDSLILGKRLKKRRTEMKLSLRALAEKTDLTASFLSQLERGITSSSLKSLQRIADALNVPMLYFLSSNSNASPVVRAGQRAKLELDNDTISYELLSPNQAERLESMMRALKPGGEVIARPLSVETEQMIFLLEGVLTVVLKDREYTLNMGDSIYFNGDDLVKLTCGNESQARWISVITPPVF